MTNPIHKHGKEGIQDVFPIVKKGEGVLHKEVQLLRIYCLIAPLQNLY